MASNRLLLCSFLEGDPCIESDAIGAVKESLILKLEECNDPNEMINRGVDRRFYTTEYNFILSPEKVSTQGMKKKIQIIAFDKGYRKT